MSVLETGSERGAVGRRVPRIDAEAKVKGAARFAGDFAVGNMLHARPVLSPYAHARIVSIETEQVLSLPGVIAVLLAKDLPMAGGRGGSRSLEPLARSEVVFAGQPVALVIAETEEVAADGAELLSVDYEPVDAVVDVEEAIRVGSQLARLSGRGDADLSMQHTEVGSGSEEEGSGGPTSENVVGRHVHANGDLDAAFAACAAVAEGRFRTSWVHQSYMEPQAAVAWVDPEGRLVVHASTQGHFYARTLLSQTLGLPLSKVRVVAETLGGAFGGKIGLIEPLVGAAALALQRPVRLVLTRSEDFAATNPAPGCVIDLKVGADAEGTLRAIDARILMDAGAFPESSEAAVAAGRIAGPYKWPSWRVRSFGVLTNRFGAGAYRGPTAPQTAFALESLLDDVAARLNMDPIDLRLRNVPGEGDRRIEGLPWPPIGLAETLQAVRTHPLWNRRHQLPPNEGIGVAAGMFPGGRQGAGAVCRMDADGTFVVSVGAVDMTGTSSSFASIAAEVLGVPVDRVKVVVPDTDSAPPATVSGGSMVTYSVGPAVRAAADAVRDQILQIAASELEIDPGDLEVADGTLSPRGVPSRGIPLTSVAKKTSGFGAPYAPVSASATALPPDLSPSVCVNVAHVKVDPDTGQVQVIDLVSAQDVGHAINPSLCEGQMRGGAAQGVGWALFEQLVHDESGQLITASFLNYAIPRMETMPRVSTVIVEVPSRHGPFGAKGIGESAAAPGAAAIANAIAAATGCRMHELPMTAQRVWRAMNDKADQSVR